MASSSYALALIPSPSPVTNLATRLESTPLIHLFGGIAVTGADQVMGMVQEGLRKWREKEVEGHTSKLRPMVLTAMPLGVTMSTGQALMEPNPDYDENYTMPASLRLSFKEVGLSSEGAIFVHLTRTTSIASLFSTLKRSSIPMPDYLDHNERQTWAFPRSAMFPTFNLVQAESLDKGRDLFDALQSSEELAGGDEGLRVAGEHSIDIAEVVVLEGEEGKWTEVGRVRLAG